jgi:hypothetical protein
MKLGEAVDQALLLEKRPALQEAPITSETLVRAHINAVHQLSEDCSIILIPEKDYDLYAYAKQLCDFNRRHVLFATGPKLLKTGWEQVMSNLALRVNMKFSGQSHYLKPAELDKLLPKIRAKTIVLSADIGYSGAGGNKGSPSVAVSRA